MSDYADYQIKQTLIDGCYLSQHKYTVYGASVGLDIFILCSLLSYFYCRY